MPAHNRLTIPVSLSHPAKPSIRKKRIRQSWNTFLRPVCRWRGARFARRTLATVPAAVRIAFVVATILAVVSLVNVVYQVVRKPTELLFFVGGALDKVPSETWQQYWAVCRKYSTARSRRAARCAGADREHGQSGGAHLLALAADLEPFRGVQACLERRRPISDDRCGLRRGEPLLRPPARCRGCRLLVQQPIYPRGAKPRHRARGGVPGPRCRGGSRLRTRHDGEPEQKQDLAALIHSAAQGPPGASCAVASR